MDVFTQMKLFNKILRVIGVSVEVQALIKAWDASRPLRLQQGSLDTAFSRYETARSLVKKARSFEDTPQRLLSRVIGNRIVSHIDALYENTKTYLRSDSLYEAATGECKHQQRQYSSDLHYKIIVGTEWNPVRLALIARYQIAGADTFEGQTIVMSVRFGYDDDDTVFRDKTGYKVNALILAPEWVCAKLRSDNLRYTESVEAVNTCVDTVVAFWQKGMFNADQDFVEAQSLIKVARQLDTPRPDHQKVS